MLISGMEKGFGGILNWKKYIEDYHDLYVQSYTLLLTDIFENFWNKSIETNELDPACFFTATGLAWQWCLEKSEIELELLTHIDMLQIVEKGVMGEICHAINRYAKANFEIDKMTQWKKSIIYYVLGCKQFVHMSNEKKIYL